MLAISDSERDFLNQVWHCWKAIFCAKLSKASKNLSSSSFSMEKVRFMRLVLASS